jgi:hypothetical protein
MLLLFSAGFVFLFLVVGAAVYVICGLVPPLRKFALSAALWCAVWGPCMVAWLTLTGLILGAHGVAMEAAKAKHIALPALPNLWTGYGVFGLVAIVFVVTVVAWLHQIVVRRMTYALFRIYAGLVSTGVGSVWGWCLYLWLIANPGWGFLRAVLVCVPAMVLLCVGFGYAGFRWARRLRGEPPTRFRFVTREEFEGTVLR